MGHIGVGAGENDDDKKISPRPAPIRWFARAHHPHRGGEFFGCNMQSFLTAFAEAAQLRPEQAEEQ